MTFKKISIVVAMSVMFASQSYALVDRTVQAKKIRNGSGLVNVNSSGTVTVPNATDTLVGKATSDVLTNKTFDADGTGNVLSNVENADIKTGAAIDRAKLANGTSGHVVINSGAGAFSSEANLAVSRGGTGAGTLTLNNVLLGNGTSAVQFVAPGTNGNILTSNGTTWQSSAPGSVVTAASQAEMEAASDTTKFVTPDRTQYHPGTAKAWFYATVSGGTPSIVSSHNITGITDIGVGHFSVEITTDFSSASYAASGITGDSSEQGVVINDSDNTTASDFYFYTVSNNFVTGTFDFDVMSVTMWGDQ